MAWPHAHCQLPTLVALPRAQPRLTLSNNTRGDGGSGAWQAVSSPSAQQGMSVGEPRGGCLLAGRVRVHVGVGTWWCIWFRGLWCPVFPGP